MANIPPHTCPAYKWYICHVHDPVVITPTKYNLGALSFLISPKKAEVGRSRPKNIFKVTAAGQTPKFDFSGSDMLGDQACSANGTKPHNLCSLLAGPLPSLAVLSTV